MNSRFAMIYEIHENWYLTKTNDLAVEENPPQIRDEENSFNFCHLHKNIISWKIKVLESQSCKFKHKCTAKPVQTKPWIKPYPVKTKLLIKSQC